MSIAREQNGFTLIELLTVVAIIGILLAILIPNIGTLIDRAPLSENTANLRSLHTQTMLYAADNKSRLPPSSRSGTSTGNFYTILRNAGYIELRNFGNSRGEGPLFNPLLVVARKNEIRNSTAVSYAVNFWATGGAIVDGALHRSSATNGLLANASNISRMALFMDGKWNGTTWPVQIGNWPLGQNLPDFSYPSSKVGQGDPQSMTQVIFLDGHVESIKSADFETDLDTYFWKGSE